MIEHSEHHVAFHFPDALQAHWTKSLFDRGSEERLLAKRITPFAHDESEVRASRVKCLNVCAHVLSREMLDVVFGLWVSNTPCCSCKRADLSVLSQLRSLIGKNIPADRSS